MLRCVLFLLMTICVFINSVASDDDSKGTVDRRSQGRYNFNHPPSVESYDPIPVAVVYDDGKGGISEQPKLKGSDSNESFKVDLSNEENDAQTISQTPETTTMAASTVDKTKLKPKPRRLSESQIPVAVVYEDDSDISIKKTDTTTEKTKKNSQPRRRTGHKINSKSNIPRNQIRPVTATEKAPEKSVLVSSGDIKPRTFPKRLSGRDLIVPIVDSESYVFSHSGNFHYRYESGDGSRAYSEGELKKVDEGRGEAVKGGFSYTDKDGNDYSISYTADENGYRPVGAHLPTPPPIPPAIARALAYLATATTPEPVTKRSKSKKNDEE